MSFQESLCCLFQSDPKCMLSVCSCCDVELSGMPLHGCMLWETPSMLPSSKHPKSCYNHPLSLFFLPNCRKLKASMYNPFKTPHKLHIFNLSLSSILFFLFKIQKHTGRASASCSSSLQPLPHCWKPIDPTSSISSQKLCEGLAVTSSCQTVSPRQLPGTCPGIKMPPVPWQHSAGTAMAVQEEFPQPTNVSEMASDAANRCSSPLPSTELVSIHYCSAVQTQISPCHC